MSVGKLSLQTRAESAPTISARRQLLQSFRDPEYRRLFTEERLRSSVALQIRALRQQRDMTQAKLGEAIGMAQTWVSKLEDPEYGKMTVATLLRLAAAFDTDLEIKFRPFSKTLDTLPTQGPEYFHVASFEDDFGAGEFDASTIDKVRSIEKRLTSGGQAPRTGSALDSIPGSSRTSAGASAPTATSPWESASGATNLRGENGYGYYQSAAR
jgi:transcriptional regulator with XRE-family HTH domain